MSYSDYLAGFRDGFTSGVKIGCSIGYRAGYRDGYGDGYIDASMGLPYEPRKQFPEYKLNLPEPRPFPKIDFLPSPTLNASSLFKREPSLAREDFSTLKLDSGPKFDFLGSFNRSKKSWEF